MTNAVINPWFNNGQSPWTFGGGGQGTSFIGNSPGNCGVCPGNPSNYEADVYYGNPVTQNFPNIPVALIKQATLYCATSSASDGTLTITVHVVYSDTTATNFNGSIANDGAWHLQDFLSTLSPGKLIAQISLEKTDSSYTGYSCFDFLDLEVGGGSGGFKATTFFWLLSMLLLLQEQQRSKEPRLLNREFLDNLIALIIASVQ